MSSQSILRGPLSYLQVCVIATNALRRCVKPSVAQAKAAAVAAATPSASVAAPLRPDAALQPCLISHFTSTASQHARPLTGAAAAAAPAPPAVQPTPVAPKLRRRSLPPTRQQVILGITGAKHAAGQQQQQAQPHLELQLATAN